MQVLFLLLFGCTVQSFGQSTREEFELIGSRTYEWDGSDVLRCRHWDRVAVKWHISSCVNHASRHHCTGGSNAHYANHSEPATGLPKWQNAFTFVQLPQEIKQGHEQYLKLSMDGYDNKVTRVRAIAPLKIDIDWKWSVDKKGCNHFSVRMSALSTIEPHRLKELKEFCEAFDTDHFVNCDHL